MPTGMVSFVSGNGSFISQRSELCTSGSSKLGGPPAKELKMKKIILNVIGRPDGGRFQTSSRIRSNNIRRLLICVAVIISVTGSVFGQDAVSSVEKPVVVSPLVTATATAKRVRFVAPGTVLQLRLEVYNEAGEKVFDTELRGGNVLDWNLQNGAGERLVPGSYACVTTVKSLSGRLSQRTGTVTVSADQTLMQPAEATQLSLPQQQAIGPMEGTATLAVLQSSETEAVTAVVHTGAEAQVSRTRGALSFRMGDFFSGNDKEQMRLTEDGKLGIGTADPQARLDVAGDIRATGVISAARIQFPDGTIQTSAQNGKLDSKLNASSNPFGNLTGSGTQDKIAKWLDNVGTLGDSTITETGGNVGIGTTSPLQKLHVVGGKSLFQNTGTASLFIVDRTDGKIAAMGAGGASSTFAYDDTGIFKIESNSRANIAAGVFGSAVGATTRLAINSSGNVGIGTETPATKLDVVGDINTSTQYKIGSSRILSNAGSGNLFAGVNAGQVNTGSANSFFGSSAGAANTTGFSNSFFGSSAGSSNTTGQVNAFFGEGAGQANTTGSANSFFGSRAGNVNTVGGQNAFFGESAGAANTTGASNSFFGAQAGRNNTDGLNNSFFGTSAGSANLTGVDNSFFGNRAGAANTASFNTFFGSLAGTANTTGNNNAFFGKSAGGANTQGFSNSFFGGSSGAANTTGSDNSFFGKSAGAANNTGALNSFFGKSAGAANTTGNSNSFFGSNAGIGNTTASNNSFFGESAGTTNTTGSSNSFFGKSAGALNTTGASNSFFGESAGLSNTTGTGNSFFGKESGVQNTTGGGNAFFGVSAGASNTTGYSNSMFGGNAGDSNTTGANNSLFGHLAGAGNTTGDHNSFFGSSAGFSNSTGTMNSFFGSAAGLANTTGANNSFFGKNAGTANTTASDNSFFGESAGAVSTTGANNSFFGKSSGAANTTASNNSFFGRRAGADNTVGQNNSFFGADAGATNTLGSNNSFFGKSAGINNTTASFNTFFGAAAGSANTTGASNSFFGKDAGGANTTGASNAFVGYNAGEANTTGSTNTFVGDSAGLSNTTENDNTFIGANSNGAAGITNATAIGANATVSQSDSLVLGSGVKVGIGSSQPAEKLHVVGNVFIGGNPAAGANGLILKSPNGATCAKLTIDNAGVLVTAVIACP